MTIFWVMLAGGLGSGARFLISQAAANALGAQFPYGTVIVNVVGCFALGVVAQLASVDAISPQTRAAVAAGFLGGFTTYSSFNQETIAMFSGGASGAALSNIAITLAGGLAAGVLGAAAGRMFLQS